ncbi:MAG: hypothetical protein ACI4NX_07415 [Megasphaera elsdenii]|uniref:hypothetical protein n=1 Tax=Megasphaera elsdenii TaxID=907 RepID=UPI003EFC0BC5
MTRAGYHRKTKADFVVRLLCAGILTMGVVGTVFGESTKEIDYDDDYDVYGKFEESEKDVSGYHVIVTSGKISQNVVGASSQGKGAMNNSVDIGADGSVGGNVIGGYGNDQETNNKVTTKGTIKGNVYGGYMENPRRKLDASTDNSVSRNRVTVTGGSVAGKVMGGFADNPYEDWAAEVATANANTNTVLVTGGTIGSAKKASEIIGGRSLLRRTSGNKVEVSGGTVYANIFGGKSGGSGVSSKNAVTIKNGSVHGNVYGGYSNSGSVSGNLITLYRGISGNIYGGYSKSGRVSGNTLAIRNDGVTAKGIYNVRTMNFYLPKDTKNGDTMLKSHVVVPSEGTTVNAYASGGLNLNNGNSVYLIRGPIDTRKGKLNKGTLSLGVSKNVPVTYKQVTKNTSGDYVKLIFGKSGSNILNVKKPSSSAKGILNVDKMNFYLPKEIKNGDVMLKAADKAKNPTVVNAYANNGVSLKTGNSVYLLKGPIDTKNGSLKNGTLSLKLAKNIPILYHQLTENKNSDYIKLTIGEATHSPKSISADDTYGGYSFNSHDDVAYKYIQITGPLSGDAIGGRNFGNTFDSRSTASVQGNTVDFTTDDAGSGYGKGKIAGGISNNIAVKNNEVDIRRGVIETPSSGTKLAKTKLAKVYGGYSTNGDVEGNSVNVYREDTIAPTIFRDLLGGYSKHGNAIRNTVTVNLLYSDKIYGSVYGGYSTSGDALHNIVDVTCSAVGDADESKYQNSKLIGGYSKQGNAIGNEVTAKTGRPYTTGPLFVMDNVIGGDSGSTLGTVSDNSVTLQSANVAGFVIGGRNYDKNGKSKLGSVHNNTVTLTNGAYYSHSGSQFYIAGGEGWKVPVYSNRVSISGDGFYGQYIYGGKSYYSNADKNIVTFNDGRVGTVYGGYSIYGGVSGNKVTVSGDMKYVPYEINYGGKTYIIGGYSQKGTVKSNVVTMNSNIDAQSPMKYYLYGGYGAGSGKVTANTVNVKSNFSGTVYGGYSSGNGAVTNNRVNLYHSVNANIIGGYSKKGSVSGNTLGVQALYNKPLTAKTISNMKNLNFYLPQNIKNGLTVLKADVVVPKEGTTVNMYANGGVNLRTGNSVYLLKGKIDTRKGKMKQGKLYCGVSKTLSATYQQRTQNKTSDYIKVTFKQTAAPKRMAKMNVLQAVAQPASARMMALSMAPAVATADVAASALTSADTLIDTKTVLPASQATTFDTAEESSALNPQTKSFVETSAFSAAMISNGADLLIHDGMENAQEAVNQEGAGNAHYVPYLAMNYNNLRYNTGSHVDADGWGINGGLARKLKNSHGELLIGPFLEYGRGSYDSYLNDGKHADGDAHYVGGGLFAKQTNHNGFYYEGSVRGGHVYGNYKSKDLQIDGIGNVFEKYDYSTTYYGIHFGVGKERQLSKQNRLNTYVRYLYTHQKGFNATMTTGEPYYFDSVDSSRVRIGTRMTHAINPKNSWYAGLAYQYEFNNEASAIYQGDRTPSPSLQGSSGMVELGWQLNPDANAPFTMNLGVTGWTGKQEGVTFQLGMNWRF